MALDNHQKIVEIVRHSAGQPPNRFHFLRLTKLLFQKMALADVLRHNEPHSPPGIVKLMGDQLDLKKFSTLLAVFAYTLAPP
jgi:hypothetical protein